MNIRILLPLAFCLFLILGCKQSDKQQTIQKTAKPVVVTTNYPLKYFAEYMAADFADIQFPASKSNTPAYWRPSSEHIAAMQRADLILINGASYEKWLDNVSLPVSKMVNTTAAFEADLITVREAVTHSHGPEGEHAHTGTAFTTWLDFSLAAKQAESAYNALLKILPEHKDELEKEFRSLQTNLLQLDEAMMKLTKNASAEIVFSHPVYQYFQKRYGIKGHSVHWEPNAEITKEMWHDLEHAIHHHKTGWMVWEGTPLDSSVESLKQIGIQSVVFNPCSAEPEEGDFFTVMKTNIEELRKVYSTTPS